MPDSPLYDVAIVGGGPAGCAAAVYCARKSLQTVLITESFGGQSIVSNDIQNWIGEVHISGLNLAQKLETHIRSFTQLIDIQIPDKVVAIQPTICRQGSRICDFSLKFENGKVVTSKSVIIASGARRKKLGVLGEDKFEGKGVSYCSTCDAPLFKNKLVLVIGGGNAGLEAVEDLVPYAREITLIHNGKSFTADKITVEKVKSNVKNILLDSQVQEIRGDSMVKSIKYQDLKSGAVSELAADGVFVEIGSVPNSELARGLVQIDQFGQIMVNAKHATTSHPGIFAAGDVTDDPYKQNNISAGDGVRAALAAYSYLLGREKVNPMV